MRTTKGRRLFSAKCHCQTTGLILMNGTDQRRKRCFMIRMIGHVHMHGIHMLVRWRLSCFISHFLQIKMSTETERRVENLLTRSKEALTINDSAGPSAPSGKQSFPGTSTTESDSTSKVDKQRFSAQLRDLQNSKKVLLEATVFLYCVVHIVHN